jgi:hypothetical protein
MLTFIPMLFAVLMSAAPPEQNSGNSDGSQKKAAPKSKSTRPAQASLTGCVDEQDGKYVLLDDRMLNKLANLETAIASSEDFFAKHMGHKVIVKGTKASGQENIFKVTSIEDIAEVCAPSQGTNQQ